MVEDFKMSMTKKYAEFNGRASHSEYWDFIVLYYVILFGLASLVNLSNQYGSNPFELDHADDIRRHLVKEGLV